MQHRGSDTKVNVVSICCVDPEELLKEMTLESSPKLEDRKKVDEKCLLPLALTKSASSAKVHTRQSDRELTKKTSSWKNLNVTVEEAPDEQHNDTPDSHPSGKKVRVLPTDLDKDRRESFGFMIPAEVGMDQDWQRKTSQTGSISSSKKGGFRGLFGFAKRKREGFCKGSPTDSKPSVTKTTR